MKIDDEGRLLVGASISPFDIKRAKALDDYVDVLVSDVAHFHNENILKAANAIVNRIRNPQYLGLSLLEKFIITTCAGCQVANDEIQEGVKLRVSPDLRAPGVQ